MKNKEASHTVSIHPAKDDKHDNAAVPNRSFSHWVRALLRIAFFAIGSSFYILRYLSKAIILGNDLDRGLRLRKEWFQLIHQGLGVEIELIGSLPTKPGLLVCNHRSYYDPLLVLAYLYALPVGKAQVANWPIIGYGAKLSGAIFVERRTATGRAQARKDILTAINNGYFVINYPEGTTHTSSTTKTFKPGMFKDAAAQGFPVYPVVHEYQHKADAWVGDDTFMRHFFECFGKRRTHVRLSFGPPQQGLPTEQLLPNSKDWIDQEISRLRKGWYKGDEET